jgi:hypothetical protein
MGHTKVSPKRKVYNNECIHYKDRKISNKQPNATSQMPRKMRTCKPQISRSIEIIKIWAKINEIETKKHHTKNQ